jgi:hypothetical protein
MFGASGWTIHQRRIQLKNDLSRLFLGVILASFGTLVPGIIEAQECEPGCLGCDLEFIGGSMYHSTTASSTGDACVDEEQEEAHGSGLGCSSEPHGGDCAGGCFTAHSACIVEEEDLKALVALAKAENPLDLQRILSGIEADVRWNEERGAFQMLSKCSLDVILHVPTARGAGAFPG